VATVFDNQRLDFNCPKCGKKISETIGRLNRGDYKCAFCGAIFNTANFRREVEKADRTFHETVRRMGGK